MRDNTGEIHEIIFKKIRRNSVLPLDLLCAQSSTEKPFSRRFEETFFAALYNALTRRLPRNGPLDATRLQDDRDCFDFGYAKTGTKTLR